MKQWIKKWYEYYLMRYRFRKGQTYSQTFKRSLQFNNEKFIEARVNSIVKEIEIKYMYPLDFRVIEGTIGNDFIKNKITIKIDLWLKTNKITL